jgi:hypothetical protein
VTSREFQERLARRAKRAGVSIAGELGHQLEAYYRLLAAWNTKINLTGLNLAELPPDGCSSSHSLPPDMSLQAPPP